MSFLGMNGLVMSGGRPFDSGSSDPSQAHVVGIGEIARRLPDTAEVTVLDTSARIATAATEAESFAFETLDAENDSLAVAPIRLEASRVALREFTVALHRHPPIDLSRNDVVAVDFSAG